MNPPGLPVGRHDGAVPHNGIMKRNRAELPPPSVESSEPLRPPVSTPNCHQLNKAIVSAPGPPGVLLLVREHLPRFNAVNCATALARLSRGKPPSLPSDQRGYEVTLASLILHTRTRLTASPLLEIMNAKTLTSIAHAIALLPVAPDTLPLLLAAIVRSVAGLPTDAEGLSGAYATCIWAMGTLRWTPSDAALTSAFCDGACRAAPQMSAAEVSNTAWGCAKARLRSATLFSAIARVACTRARAGEFNEQGLANTAYGFAKFRLHNAQLFSALRDAALVLLASPVPARHDSQALATLAWAWSRWPDASLNAAICRVLSQQQQLQSLPPQSVASLLQSFAGDDSGSANSASSSSSRLFAPGVDPAVVSSLGGLAVRNISLASAQELGLIAGSIARRSIFIAKEAAAAVALDLARRCAAVSAGMDWRGVAAAELALRTLLPELFSVHAERASVSSAAVDTIISRPRAAVIATAAAADAKVTSRAPAAAAAAGHARTPPAVSDSDRHLDVPDSGGLLHTHEQVQATMYLLSARAASAAREVGSLSRAYAASASALLLSLSPSLLHVVKGTKKAAAESLLLIGDDPSGRITGYFEERGLSVHHWRRFASDGAADDAPLATAWPSYTGNIAASAPQASTLLGTAASSRPASFFFDAAVLRFPQGSDACAFAAHAAACALKPGAVLLLVGSVEEGIGSIAAGTAASIAAAGAAFDGPNLSDLFTGFRTVVSSANGMSVVSCARSANHSSSRSSSTDSTRATERSSSDSTCTSERSSSDTTRTTPASGAIAPLGTWVSLSELRLPPPFNTRIPNWMTLPGLFASGGLDCMTSALLSVLPTPPPRSRVLDFACGSGSISAALLAREPSLRVYMLDADAVALATAGVNVPRAHARIRSDGWPKTHRRHHKLKLQPGARRFACIVSNPPVHRGQPDDFSVLCALLEGAPLRLVPGGSLWIVAQAQVPVGRLMAAVATTDGSGRSASSASSSTSATASRGIGDNTAAPIDCAACVLHAASSGGCADGKTVRKYECHHLSECAYASCRAISVDGGRFIVWHGVVR